MMDERKNRQSWLDAGLHALVTEGPQALKIMPIAEQLGVTKGSFYWHFRNLEEYRLAVLGEWERQRTDSAIECVESDGGDGKARLKKWITGAAHMDFRLESAIRSWAFQDQSAREVLSRVDQKRIDYIVKLLGQLGRSKSDAEAIGRWTYWAWVGYATMDGQAVTDKQIATILSLLIPA